MTTLVPPPVPNTAVGTTAETLRVLVVDDSLLYRKIVRDALAEIPNVEVIGSAANGQQALEKIAAQNPDLITLDFEMPELDGLGVLRALKQKRLSTKAVMVSALTAEGATSTVQALQQGAFDFVLKPTGGDARTNHATLVESLRERVDAVRHILGKVAKPKRELSLAATAARTPTFPAVRREPLTANIGIVGIGCSTGGPDALRIMLPKLPADFPVPIVLVQHMPPVFTRSLAASLDKLCSLRVMEAEDGQPVRAGQILIAPGGRHMKVVLGANGLPLVKLNNEAPVQSCRPAVDVLFWSLAEAFGAKTLSVIMTGMGYDGADGCRKLHQLGGPVIAQNEASCVVFGMPRKPVEEGIADAIVPLDQIANEIVRYTGKRTRP